MSKPKSVRVLIVDDHPIVRMGLVSLLKANRAMNVVATAEDGETAVRLAAETHPDVIVVDLMMPGMDGVETTRRLLAQDPSAKVMILTSFTTAVDISRAIEAGARAAVTKTTEFADIVEDITRVANGERVYSDDIARILSAPKPPNCGLTPRQMSILVEIVNGKTNKHIADALGISLDVVKKHVAAICEKLGAANRAEAAALALKKQLIEL